MIQALRGLQALQDLLEQTAQCQDLQVQPVQLVLQDQLVILVQLVRQEIQVLQVRLDLREQLGLLEQLVQPVIQDLKVLLEILDQQDQREQLEPLVLPVLLVRQALMQLRYQGYLC